MGDGMLAWQRPSEVLHGRLRYQNWNVTCRALPWLGAVATYDTLQKVVNHFADGMPETSPHDIMVLYMGNDWDGSEKL